MKRLWWKFKYYLRRLRQMDWNGFFRAIDYAHKKSGKSRIYLFFDMIYASMKYAAGYVDYNEFEFYALNNEQRKTYLTLGMSIQCALKYNDKDYVGIFDDKIAFNQKFSDFVHRDFIVLTQSSAADFETFVRKHGKVMVKRHNDYVGRGIDKIDFNENPDIDLKQLYEDLLANGQILVEEFFTQHPKMSELAPNSVNTMRVITFLDDDHEGQVLVAALKIGLGGYVDNIGQGGMYTILDDRGRVSVPFVDKQGDLHSIHPITGQHLIGFEVPDYQHLMEQVKAACKVVPQVRYVGWDIAVTPEGDVEIIEGNSSSGPFQLLPSLSEDKIGIRPVYEKYMDINFGS